MAAQIPVIDFSDFTSGDKETRLKVSKAVASAFRTFGFVYLTNHPIEPSLLKTAFSMSKSFFSLPPSTKSLAPHPPGFAIHRGYSQPGLEKVSDLTQGIDDEDAKNDIRDVPDIKESYEIGSEQYPEQPNVWLPDDALPGFRQFMTDFYWTLADFSGEILKVLALGIGLEDENYLQNFYTGEHNQLRLLRYPEVEAETLEAGRGVRIPAHCDWSAFTLLFQDDCGGLEIESPTEPGRYIPVEPIENACLVNIGDLMARWSNDFLKSTSHRVGPPPLQDRYTGNNRLTRERYSIPYFVTTTPDSVIECLPSCTSDENPAKYPPVTQKQYNVLKASMNYS